MRLRSCAWLLAPFAVVAACAQHEDRTVDAPVAPALITTATTTATVNVEPGSGRPPAPLQVATCASGLVVDAVTGACITACGAQPAYSPAATAPTCTDVTLKSGQAFHDQLTLMLSSGASTRIDCPRMRFRGQDTPVCVTKNVGGRMRGACCPPGHADPSDPECVAEGSVDEMYKRRKVWEWCKPNESPQRPCDPCVWVTDAARQ